VNSLVQSILAPIDFSSVTDAVVKTAVHLAAACNAKLIFVHVASPDADFDAGQLRSDVSRQGVALEMHSARHALQKIEIDCKSAGVDAKALLVRGSSLRGNPIRKILQEISRLKPDLIVLGSHGHGLIHDVLMGSTSAAVIHKAACPVLIVPARKRPPRGKRPAQIT
jgi:nucleotide-binding universal stress UspA family protein